MDKIIKVKMRFSLKNSLQFNEIGYKVKQPFRQKMLIYFNSLLLKHCW